VKGEWILFVSFHFYTQKLNAMRLRFAIKLCRRMAKNVGYSYNYLEIQKQTYDFESLWKFTMATNFALKERFRAFQLKICLQMFIFD
jgi:hypothetical protein